MLLGTDASLILLGVGVVWGWFGGSSNSVLLLLYGGDESNVPKTYVTYRQALQDRF